MTHYLATAFFLAVLLLALWGLRDTLTQWNFWRGREAYRQGRSSRLWSAAAREGWWAERSGR